MLHKTKKVRACCWILKNMVQIMSGNIKEIPCCDRITQMFSLKINHVFWNTIVGCRGIGQYWIL